MNLARAFTWVLEDEAWKKRLGVLLLLSFIPGLNVIALTGYSLTIAHNVVRGASRPLPAWNEWIDILVRGLMALMASAAYFLPLAAVLIVVGVANLFSRVSSVVMLCLVPFALIYTVIALGLLTAGHVRYARSDQYSDYYQVRRRVDELRANLSDYLPIAGTQVLLTLAAIGLFFILVPTLVGGFIVFCALSAANGYFFGVLARTARRR
jgi:hypothetical protein